MAIPKHDLFHRFCDCLIIAIFVFSMIAVPINIIQYITKYPDVFNRMQCIPFVVAIIGFVGIVKVMRGRTLSYGWVVGGSFAMANLIMLAQLMSFDTRPVSDYGAIWHTACAMANGEFDIHLIPHSDYIYVFNWQLGISAIESVFVRIFGETTLPLKFFNLLVINATLYLILKLANFITTKDAAKYALFLSASFYPTLVTVGQLSNQHLVTPLILIVIFCVFRRRWLVCGFLVALINMIRPLSIILVIATIVMFVYEIARPIPERKCMKVQFMGLLTYFVALFATQAVIDCTFIKLNYADSSICVAKIPYFKFDCGLTGYNLHDVAAFNGDLDAYNAWEKEKVIQTITQRPLSTAFFVVNKMCRYLGCFDWKFEMTYNQSGHYSSSVKSCVGFGYGQYLVVLFLALLGYIYGFKDKELSFLQIFYIGITFVYLFIEAFSSYRYESYPIVMILAGLGWEKLNGISDGSHLPTETDSHHDL